MMPTTIKSRPTYPGLHAVPAARRNIVAVEGEGAVAVLRMLEAAPVGFAGRTHVLYAAVDARATYPERLRVTQVGRLDVVADPGRALGLLQGLLCEATMGTRVYAAGSEGFVGQVVRLGFAHGIDHKSILTEHAGSLARRVRCVHCKHCTERVTASVFGCEGCGVLLFVRDHYSRRLAAFQGVCVNAEDPGELPVSEQVYP